MKSLFKALMRFMSAHYGVLRGLFLTGGDLAITLFAVLGALFIFSRASDFRMAWPEILTAVASLFLARAALFFLLRVYRVSFQFANPRLTLKIFGGVLVSSIAVGITLGWLAPGRWPLMLAVMEMMFAAAGCMTFRFSALLYSELARVDSKSRMAALIYGAGESGRSVAGAFREGTPGVRILGFIDDDPNKRGKVILGHKVLGGIEQLEAILASRIVNELLVAIPSLPGARLRELRRRCMELNVAVKVMPSVYELHNKAPEQWASEVREIDLEDLLRRPARQIPFDQLRAYCSGKRFLVTGGGGTIGLELVSQLARLSPEKVVVADMSEFNLYQAEMKLGLGPDAIETRLIDIKDRDRLALLFEELRPHVVLNAAAYKHVPFVERNPVVGVLNNVVSLRNTVDLAQEFEVEQFLLVSTDKAVNPSSVMGATKRIGELYVQASNGRSRTRCCSVRFGNVLGSSGSLVPTVVKRIVENKPILVTDPNMTRYFMSIPEAVSLILEACLLAKGGEIFVLDMGDPIRIMDLIADICLLYGKQAGKTHPMEIIGARPGEKTHEELVYPGERTTRVADGILMAECEAIPYEEAQDALERILSAATANDGERMLAEIQRALTLSPHVEGDPDGA